MSLPHEREAARISRYGMRRDHDTVVDGVRCGGWAILPVDGS